MTRAVPRGPDPGCQGISAKVFMSGTRYWSDSAIRVNPSMDEPSNHVPWATEAASWWMGMVTAFTCPRMSVNWSWTKRIPRALAASIFSWATGSISGATDDLLSLSLRLAGPGRTDGDRSLETTIDGIRGDAVDLATTPAGGGSGPRLPATARCRGRTPWGGGGAQPPWPGRGGRPGGSR